MTHFPDDLSTRKTPEYHPSHLDPIKQSRAFRAAKSLFGHVGEAFKSIGHKRGHPVHAERDMHAGVVDRIKSALRMGGVKKVSYEGISNPEELREKISDVLLKMFEPLKQQEFDKLYSSPLQKKHDQLNKRNREAVSLEELKQVSKDVNDLLIEFQSFLKQERKGQKFFF